MDPAYIAEKILAFKIRLSNLQTQIKAREARPIAVTGDALDEIQLLTEELNVAIEAIQEQNENLQVARQEAEQGRERYQALFDFAPDGYLVTDLNGNIREANQAAGKMFNISPQHLIGKPLTLYIDKQDLPHFHIFINKLNSEQSQVAMQHDFLLRPRGRNAFPASLTVAPARTISQDGEGKGGLRWLVHDATERQHLLAQLQASNTSLEQRVAERTAELERKNRELQDFAFIASHDLREPLRKVQTFAGLIKERYGFLLPAEGLDFLERMVRANVRMEEMLQGLLDYSRVNTRGEAFQPINLNHILERVLFDLELLIDEEQATLEAQPLPEIEADANQIRRLYQNLIDNALKFHDPDTPPQIQIWAEPDGPERVKLMVKDHGIGFAPKFAVEIFEPFRRLNSRAAYGGVGMGLAICKKIVERHQGEIWAESQPGLGSVFTVVLPLKQLARSAD